MKIKLETILLLAMLVVLIAGFTLFFIKKDDLSPIISKLEEIKLSFADVKDEIKEDAYGYAHPVSDYYTTLSSAITDSATSFTVASVTTQDSVTLTSALIYPGIFLTIDPSNSDDKEIVFCEDISGTTFQDCVRGLAFSATTTENLIYATTTAWETSGNKKSHPAGVDVIASNPNLFYKFMFMDKWSNETVYGIKTFASNTIKIGDSESTNDKCLFNINGDTAPAYLCYDEDGGDAGTGVWVASDNGSDSFQITPTSTVIAGGKNLTITSSIMDLDDTIYVPSIFASSTYWISGADSVAYIDTSGNFSASGTLIIGYDGIFATSTIYDALETPVLNVTTTTATSTFANGLSLSSGCITDPTGQCLSANRFSQGQLSTSTLSDTLNGDTMIAHGLGRTPSRVQVYAACFQYGISISSSTIAYSVGTAIGTGATDQSSLRMGISLWGGNEADATSTITAVQNTSIVYIYQRGDADTFSMTMDEWDATYFHLRHTGTMAPNVCNNDEVDIHWTAEY